MMKLNHGHVQNRGTPPWLVPPAYRPQIPGYIALDDGTFVRELRYPFIEPLIKPKRWAAIAVSGGPTILTTLGQNTGITLAGVDAGDTIVAAVTWGHATITLSSITISGESNATLLTARGPNAPDNTRMCLGYLTTVTTGGDKTVTFNMSGSVVGAGSGFAIAFSGCDQTSALDSGTDVFANGTGTSLSVSLTTSVANCAVVAIAVSNNADPSAGSGYTSIAVTNNHWNAQGQYRIDAPSGSQSVTMSTGGSGAWAIAAAAFKPAGSSNIDVAMTGSALTGGSGTQTPGTSVEL